MKHAICIVCLALMFTPAALAQSPDRQHGSMSMPGIDLSIPHVLMGDWWRDPEVINELHLTEAQRNQLEQASVNLKLSLISAAANGAAALVKAESDLNSEQLDEAAYTQQVNTLSDAAAKLVKDFGSSVLAMRRILTAEQWQKLQAMRGRHAMMMRDHGARPMQRQNERRPAPPTQ